ncbi:MAG: hypothetical protein COC10_06170 [Sphingobium sp.]|nr:MAG: hypothetical protein COC10_06170 [Sphingobium sp.]
MRSTDVAFRACKAWFVQQERHLHDIAYTIGPHCQHFERSMVLQIESTSFIILIRLVAAKAGDISNVAANGRYPSLVFDRQSLAVPLIRLAAQIY